MSFQQQNTASASNASGVQQQQPPVDLQNPSDTLLTDLMKSTLRHVAQNQAQPYKVYEYFVDHPLALVLMQTVKFDAFLTTWVKEQLPNVLELEEQEKLQKQQEKQLLRQKFPNAKWDQEEDDASSVEIEEELTDRQREILRAEKFKEGLAVLSLLFNTFSLIGDLPLGQSSKFVAQEVLQQQSQQQDESWNVRVAIRGMEAILASNFVTQELDEKKRPQYKDVIARLHGNLAAFKLTRAQNAKPGVASAKDVLKWLTEAKVHCLEQLKRIDPKKQPDEFAICRQQMALILKKEGSFAKAVEEFEKVLAMRQGAGKILTQVNLANCLIDYADAKFNESMKRSLTTALEQEQMRTIDDEDAFVRDVLSMLTRADRMLQEALDVFIKADDATRVVITRVNLLQALIRKAKVMLMLKSKDNATERRRSEVRDTLKRATSMSDELLKLYVNKPQDLLRQKIIAGELHHLRHLAGETSGDHLNKALALFDDCNSAIDSLAAASDGQGAVKVLMHQALAHKYLAQQSKEEATKQKHKDQSSKYFKLAHKEDAEALNKHLEALQL